MEQKYVYAALIVIALAFIPAYSAKNQGFFFWRTFFMSCIGFTGIGLLFLKLFTQ